MKVDLRKLCLFFNELNGRNLTPSTQTIYNYVQHKKELTERLEWLENGGLIKCYCHNGEIMKMEMTLSGDLFRMILNRLLKEKEGFWHELAP